MEQAPMNVMEEAQRLNVRVEKEGDDWIAVLPPHPDMPDEELGLPAASPEDAIVEARAYRAIEQSALYKFTFDEDSNLYRVSLGPDEHFEDFFLAKAYEKAQKAYAERISDAPKPEQPEPEQPQPKKRGRPPKQKGNGEQQPEPKALPDPEVVAEQLTDSCQEGRGDRRARRDLLGHDVHLGRPLRGHGQETARCPMTRPKKPFGTHLSVTAIRMPPQVKFKLERLSAATGLAQQEHVRRALDDYFLKLQQQGQFTAPPWQPAMVGRKRTRAFSMPPKPPEPAPLPTRRVFRRPTSITGAAA